MLFIKSGTAVIPAKAGIQMLKDFRTTGSKINCPLRGVIVLPDSRIRGITSDSPTCVLITNHLATVFWLLSGMASCFISRMASGSINDGLEK